MGQEARSVAAARSAAEEEAARVRQESSRLQQRQRDLDARMSAFESQVITPESPQLNRHGLTQDWKASSSCSSNLRTPRHCSSSRQSRCIQWMEA